MAVLSDADRQLVQKNFTDETGNLREPVTGLLRSDIRAAVNAADAWADANVNSFNTALPVAARNQLTAKQKARLLLAVIARRYSVD